MKQKKTGYIALVAVGLVIIAVIVAMVMGNHFGEKQDDALSTGVTTEKKEDLPGTEDDENTVQKADSTENVGDETQKESTSEQDNETQKDFVVNKNNRTKKKSSTGKDNGKDTSDEKDKAAEDDEVTDGSGTQNNRSTDRSSDRPSDRPADSGDTDKNSTDGTDSIELPFVPAK